MSDPQPAKRARLPFWRTTGVSLVLLAVTLSMISLILALIHARTITDTLIQQAKPQARQLADTAKSRFTERAKSALRRVADEAREPTGNPPWLTQDFPTWIDGIFRADDERFAVIVKPELVNPESTIERAQARVTPRNSDPNAVDPLEIIFDEVEGRPLVLACLHTHDSQGGTMAVAGRVHLDYLKRDLAEPLLGITRGLEIVPVGDTNMVGYAQPMSSALRYWVIKPTRTFLDEQQDIVLWQTLGYITLTVLSLLTLLAAIWLLLRVTRREIYLAEMKSNFVADVSHELKTPLALIHLFGETLQSGRVDNKEKLQEYYEIITRESGRLTQLIDNILDFARIDAGKKEYSLKPADVGEVVRSTFESYELELKHNGFEHHLVIEDNLPLVEADEGAIAQAALNLISNAIKYSRDEKYLMVDLRRETRRGRVGVLISVHDHGIGIAPEDRAHLFDGFFRSPDQRVREKRGTGIGLALVKRIVDAHDGFLIVESRLVKGSTFRIFLPATATGPADTVKQ